MPPKQSVHLGLMLAAGTLAAFSLAACNNRQSLVVPNRVLDRPTDMVMACLRRDPLTEIIAPTSLDQCVDATCGDLRLVGFIANSERDDIAMFSKCANSVLDMDEATPGAQLIPVGKVPTSMTVTSGETNGCFAVSANLGSCDLSVLDVPGLSAYAFDDVPVRDPSELVLAVTPTRGDGSPLGARPGQVLAVPPNLSNSILFGELEGDTDSTGDDGAGDSGAESTTTTGGTGGTGATGGNDIQVATCDADRPGSVYVTFPSCQLIAEVDLRTQRILQSRQFVRDPMSGDLIVKDTGVDPLCPIDCPELFADDPGILDDAPPGEVDGMYPSAMALIEPVQNPEDDADEEIRDHALFVGGLGADTLFELRYDGRRWVTDPLVLDLQDASGISAIRPTPAMVLGLDGAEPFHQFLYIIAGDGSTRVVRRELDENRSEIGRECDTQVDPTAVLDLVCHPAEFPGENPPDRRPFARGPGIRTVGGSLITDWTFQKVPKPPKNSLPDPGIARSPFGKAGVTGVGTTSFGRLVFVTFDQFNTDRAGNPTATRVSTAKDPLGLLDATIQPHMLWPTLDPVAELVDNTALPRMEDAPPRRLLPGDNEGPSALKVLAPAVRRIDMAYAELGVACAYAADDGDMADMAAAADATCKEETGDDTAFCATDGQCRGDENPLLSPHILADEGDRFGNPDIDAAGSNGLYKNEAVRAVVRDYRSWISGEWTLYWEGEIPDTSSFTGQLVCEHPGWNGGTCLSTEPGDTRIIDSTARFCDAGVLAGDKLTLFGCASDTDCGVGQFCLTDPRTPTNGTGICVSQSAYEEKENLLTICEDLIYDPCGSPVREFLITGAFQNELWLQAMDRPETAYLMYSDVPVADIPFDTEPDLEKRDPDRLDADTALCHGKYLRDLPEDAPDPSIHRNECERRLVCAPEQPETGCETHADCVDAPAVDGEPAPDSYPLCIDGLCRRACREGEDCVLRRLPGPACVQELVRYLVQGRNSFIVRGPTAYDFLDQRVRAADDGACYEDPTVSNLLTSRIRLGSDELDTRNNTAWPIPTCPPGSERPGAGTPNPCFIDTPRPKNLSSDAPEGLFHYFEYGVAEEEGQVPAIRFSNPMMSIVLDLTSLEGLIESIPGTEGASWDRDFREFHRSRIPRAFNESFSTMAGYSPFDIGVVTSSIVLVGPTRIINAPELGLVFIVDTAGGTGTGGVRGQVVRVGLRGGQSSPDEKFLVH